MKIIMNIILTFLLIILSKCSNIDAQLKILTFEPLILNLSFSEVIAPPDFLLLFNQIPIQKDILPKQSSSSFLINTTFTQNADNGQFITEKYVVMFTSPLDIANGRLALDSFSLRATAMRNTIQYAMQPISQKASPYDYQNYSDILNLISLVMCSMVYFLAYTTQVGLITFVFLSIYVYTSLVSPMFTVLDYKVAYYMLFDVNQVSNNPIYRNLYLFTPHILIIFSFIVTAICRLGLKNISQHSGFWNNMYYYFSYKFAIITWDIMCIPIFANTVYIVRSINKADFFMNKNFGCFVIYFNVVLLIFYIYMTFFGSNPQIGQTAQKWQQYTQSQHYKLFQAFHGWTDAFHRLKRNHKFIFSICRIVSLFLVTVSSSSLPNMLLQTGFLMYLLMVAPFKYNFFNIFNMGMRGLIIMVYLYRFITDVYVTTSQQIVTSRDIDRILTVNVIILCIIIGVFYVMGIYQFYQKVRVFRMNVKAFQLKTKHNAIDQAIKTKKTISSYKQQDQLISRTKKQSYTSLNNQSIMQSPVNKVKKLKQQLHQKLKNNQLSKTTQIKHEKHNSVALRKGRSVKKVKEKSSLLESLTFGVQSNKV